MGVIKEEASIYRDILHMLRKQDEQFRQRWSVLVNYNLRRGYKPLSEVCNCVYEKLLEEKCLAYSCRYS